MRILPGDSGRGPATHVLLRQSPEGGDFSADLCLNYIIHPDLSLYLVEICRKKNIPVIASGQKMKGAFTPFTCCGLGHHPALGEYGR